MNEVHALLWSCVLLATQITIAAFWLNLPFGGLAYGFGNRDEPAVGGVHANRAGRATANMLETFPLFASLLVAVLATGKSGDLSQNGAALYLAGRVLYFPIYIAGVAYLRTLVWTVSIVGIVMIGMALLG